MAGPRSSVRNRSLRVEGRNLILSPPFLIGLPIEELPLKPALVGLGLLVVVLSKHLGAHVHTVGAHLLGHPVVEGSLSPAAGCVATETPGTCSRRFSRRYLTIVSEFICRSCPRSSADTA